MSNMKHCMFENTYADLKDSLEKMDNNHYDDLSETEQKYFKLLVKLCTEISEGYQEQVTKLLKQEK